MKFDSQSKAVLATLGAQLIWGVAGPLVKVILGDIPPFSLMYLRFLFAAIFLFIIFETKLAKFQPEKTLADKKNIFLAGFFGVFLNIALYFPAQKLTTVIDAWVIASTGTLFVVILSYFVLKERLARIVYAGVALAFAGTLIILGSSLGDVGKGNLIGNLLMLGAVLAGAISFFYTKKVANKFSPLTLAYYWFLIGLVFSFPLFLWEYFQNSAWMATISLQNLAILSYLVFGSSIGSYYLSNLGLKHLSPSLAATIGYSSSVIAIGLSVIFLGEKPTTSFIIGAALIVVGLFLAESRHPRHPIHKIISSPVNRRRHLMAQITSDQ